MPVPKLSSESSSNKVTLEMLPSSKKIKTEDTLSERRQLYGGWLEALRDIANVLPSADKKIKSIVGHNARFPELLTSVMSELEHKLAFDDLKTQSSEHSFWASVRVMAETYGIDFSDFEKLCCSSEFKGLTCPSDGGIPGLVDRVHGSPWNFVQNSFSVTHPRGGNGISGLPSYSLPDYQGMASVEVFPRFPLDTARDDTYSPASPAAFGQSNFLDYPSDILGVNSSEQSHLYAPGSLYTTFPAHKINCHGPIAPESSKTIPTAGATPSKNEGAQSLPMTLNTQKPQQHFLTAVPEACKRKIQRQRRRAPSYDHLTTNFNPSSCSTWNLGNIRDSDLQFLLEKELKPSDVGNLGRIILPKRQAEDKLPPLEVKEGKILDFEDLQTSKIWHLRFRFWPNNKTRMYVLESTGDFVRLHHLQKGDSVMLYRNPATGRYVITGKKAVLPKVEHLALPAATEVSGNGKSSFKAATLTPIPTPTPTPAPTPIPATPIQGLDEGKKTNLKEAGGSSFKSTTSTVCGSSAAPAFEAASPAAPTAPSDMMDECMRSNAGGTDVVACGSCYLGGMEEPDDDIEGYNTFKAEIKPIDQIFDFKESIE